MPTVSLPDRPNLDHLRQQARDLQAAVRAHDSAAVQRIAEFYPGADPESFTLSLAQLVTARSYGFASWPRLKSYVEAAIAYRWESPVESVNDSDPADQFCRLACLNYTRDNPENWARARELLAVCMRWQERAMPDEVRRRHRLRAPERVPRRRLVPSNHGGDVHRQPFAESAERPHDRLRAVCLRRQRLRQRVQVARGLRERLRM